jgi:hypothetical protein
MQVVSVDQHQLLEVTGLQQDQLAEVLTMIIMIMVSGAKRPPKSTIKIETHHPDLVVKE